MGILNLGASKILKRGQGNLKDDMKAAEEEKARAFSKEGQLVIEMSRVLSQRGIQYLMFSMECSTPSHHTLCCKYSGYSLHTTLGQCYLGEDESVSHSISGMKSGDKKFNRS